ncbi:PKD domain-containing protein, partial [Algoriphagus sp.]|uniref:PKD domain-containing protein n=1 Tax=Algoriphagus sp. TaxID=1872435 RepID=UPI00391AA39E
EITITGTVTPTFAWYFDAGLTQPIASNFSPTGTGLMYQIDPASGQLSVYNAGKGDKIYFLKISSPDICEVTSKADVSVTEIPSPIFSVTDVLCYGESSGKIKAIGGIQSNLQFSVNGGPRISLAQLEALSFVAGDYEIKTFIETSECPDTQLLTIVEPDIFDIEISGLVNPICGSPDGKFSFTIQGGILPYVITINALPLASFNPTQIGNTYTIENLEPETYLLTITDKNGCVITESVKLENSNLLPISAEDMEETVCKGEVVTFNPVLNNSSGVSPSYTWYLDEGLTQVITSNYNPAQDGVMYAINTQSGALTVYNLPAGDFLYFLVIKDEKICDIVVKATVQLTDFPTSEFDVENIVCFGDETGKIILTSVEVADHRYTVNGGPELTKAQLENLNLGAGIYIIETKIVNSECPDIQTIEITQPDELILKIESSLNPTCDEANGDIVFTISGGEGEYTVLINGDPLDKFIFAETNGRYVVTKLAPGSYEITVKDANGCTSDSSVIVDLVNFDAVPITGNPVTAVSCEGSPLVFVPDFDSGGVEVTKRWFRDENSTQEIISNYNPADSTVMYEIDANSGELTVYNLKAGEYKFYLQLSDPQICTLALIAEGTVNEGIQAESNATPEICFGAEDGTISIKNVSGGSGNYEFSLDNITWSAKSEFENLAAGIYSVYIRDIGGAVPCLLIIPEVEVEGPTTPIAINDDFVQINASCDLPNGSISNLEITGGWGNYTVEWRKNDIAGQIVPGDKTGASNLAPGIYVLIIKDEKGCEEVIEFEILAQAKPEFIPIDPNKICEFSTATIGVINTVSGSSSTDFTWSKNPNQSVVIANGADPTIPGVSYQIREELNSIFLDIEGLPAGTYTYYFFTECTGQEIPITIEVLATPSPVFEVNSISCHDENDGKITLISGGGTNITYTLDGGNTFISQSELENMLFSPGAYTIQAQNELGCISEGQIMTIVNPELLEIQLVDSGNTACNAESGFIIVELSGGTLGYTISLFKNGQKVSSVETTQLTYQFDNLGVGSYQVEIIDSQGCTATLISAFEIKEAPTKIIIADSIENCAEEVITLSPTLNPVVSNPVFIWYWNNPTAANVISDNQMIGTARFNISSSGQINISGLASGTYSIWVEATGLDVCEGDLKEVKILMNPTPVFSASVLEENCVGEGGSILIAPAAGQTLTYSLNGGQFIAYQGNKIEGLAQGAYTLAAKNQFDCITVLPDSLVISGPQAAISISNMEIRQSNCGLDDGLLRFQLSGGSPDYKVQLLDGNKVAVRPVFNSSGGLVEFVNLPPSNYQIQITDSKGCILLEDKLLLTDVPPVIQAEDVVICVGEQAVIQPELIPSTSNPAFQWYYDLALSNPVVFNAGPDQFGATYTVSNSGELTATGLPGRPNPYSFFIAVNPGQICAPAVKEVKVTVVPLPTLRVSNPSIVCDPKGTVNLNAFIEGFNSNLFDYNIISPSGSPMRLDEITAVNQSGNYIVSASVKGRNCFTPTQRIAVIIASEELIAEFQYEINLPGQDSIVNSDVQVLEDIEFEDTSQGDVIIWNWDFGDGNTSSLQNPVHQYAAAGRYTVTLTTIDRFGCQSQYQRIIVALDDYLIIIPNAFTPTSLKNTFFYPKYRGIVSLEFYVFNTWGELIFHSKSLEGPGWNGTLNGVEVMNGNYVYRADFVTNSGEKISKAGVFILIR